MSARILRSEVVTREVEIPDGHEVCVNCAGRGMVSRYDEGWRSVMHSPEMAAKRTCLRCNGLGYVRSAAVLRPPTPEGGAGE